MKKWRKTLVIWKCKSYGKIIHHVPLCITSSLHKVMSAYLRTNCLWIIQTYPSWESPFPMGSNLVIQVSPFGWKDQSYWDPEKKRFCYEIHVCGWEQEYCKKPRDLSANHTLSLCLFLTCFAPLHLPYRLPILTAFFSLPILHISTYSFCFLITPPIISLLFQNFHCCFLVFPSSVSQRQRIWSAFLIYLYLWVKCVLFSRPILDELTITGEDIKHIHLELSFVKDSGPRRNGAKIN